MPKKLSLRSIRCQPSVASEQKQQPKRIVFSRDTHSKLLHLKGSPSKPLEDPRSEILIVRFDEATSPLLDEKAEPEPEPLTPKSKHVVLAVKQKDMELQEEFRAERLSEQEDTRMRKRAMDFADTEDPLINAYRYLHVQLIGGMVNPKLRKGIKKSAIRGPKLDVEIQRAKREFEALLSKRKKEQRERDEHLERIQ